MSGYSFADASVYSKIRKQITVTEQTTFTLLKEYVDLKGKFVLDFGCGDGFYSVRFADVGATEVIGLDSSQAFIDLANNMHARKNIRYVCADGNSLPFYEGQFDFVFANFVIQHFKDSTVPFKEIYRVLKPDGYFLFVLPTVVLKDNDLVDTKIPMNLAGVLVVYSFIKTKEQIDTELKDAGFRIAAYRTTPKTDASIDSSYPNKNEIISIPASIYLAQKSE